MAYLISQSQQSLSTEVNKEENQTQLEIGPISSQLHLISSSSSSKGLDKEVILRRIRHHKSLNKFRNVFQSQVSSFSSNSAGFDLEDAFSSP